MQTIICYVSPVSRGSVLGVFRDRLNSMGGQLPILSAGVPCVLKIRVFDEPGSTTPFPLTSLTDVTDWSFELDTDYDPATTIKLVADNADITAATVTDGGDTFTEFTIPLDYVATNRIPTHLMIVCSSSRLGDYFTGSTKSVMWVDDFELLYE